MNIELMNQKIKIQHQTVTIDSIGNHTNTWADYHTCHATVSGESGSEDQEAGLTTVLTDADFTIRWCNATKAITPDDYRVVHGSEIYNITGIDHMKYKRKCIKLRCRKERT